MAVCYPFSPRSERVLTGTDLHLVLYSQLAELVQVFPFPILADEQTESFSMADPFILDVPLAGDVLSAENTAPSPYSTFVFREVGHTSAPGPKTPYNPHMTLIKLFWVDHSLAVHETLFRGPDANRDRDEDGLLLEDRDVLHVKRRFAHRKKRGLDEENFVVDDWDESVALSGIERHQISRRASLPDLPWNADPQWTLNWTSVYALAVTNSTAVAEKGNQKGPAFTLRDFIEAVKNDPTETFADFQASETM